MGKKIGVIGLGKMGMPMARNLLRSGFTVTVLDIRAAPMEALAGEGAEQAPTAGESMARSEVALLSLPDAPSLRAVFTAEDGLFSADLRGKTIIDTTTATREAAVELAAEVARRGGYMLDAPVSGGVSGAERGTLTFFIGGERSAFERHRDVFESLGHTLAYMGESGQGQAAKMVKQILGSVQFAMGAEALGFAQQAGLNLQELAKALQERAFERALTLRESGRYGEEGYIAQRGKDLDYALQEATRIGCPVPLTQAMQELFQRAREQGMGRMYPEALFLLWERHKEE